MGRFLLDSDYILQIQDDNLLQIIESDQAIKLKAELTAETEIISYLEQRYDKEKIFLSSQLFVFANTYMGKNLVEYSEPAYSAATTYVTDDRVSQDKKIYKSIAGNSPEAFDILKWTLITENKSLYFATLPEPEFSLLVTYLAGEKVWYKDSVYTATVDTIGNLPTDTDFWGAGVPFSFTGALPDDTTKWTKGDNRNQQILTYYIDIALYHMHSRINPRNTPELRLIRYDGNGQFQKGGAIGWLKMVGRGDVNADLPILEPIQGSSITFGSTEKRINRPDNW